MKIFHRIDDINLYSEHFVEILDFFENYTQEYILGVIPYGISDRYAQVFSNLRPGSVWQHGYKHVDNARTGSGFEDEFPEMMDINVIKKDILAGKRILEDIVGMPINGYIPPYNRTSLKTVKVLYELGFQKYSAVRGSTYEFQCNKDITHDIISCYHPLCYKELNQLYQEMRMGHKQIEEVGILYHFFDMSDDFLKGIYDFVMKVEELNMA